MASDGRPGQVSGGPGPGPAGERGIDGDPAGLAVPIAVVGLAALMPGARDAAEFWRNIVTERDLITELPADRWPAEEFYDPDPSTPDTTYSRRGAFLPDIEFDPLAHGLPPATLAAIDPAQLLGLTVADALLADLDRNLAAPLDRERVSVILGSSTLSRVGTMDARIQRPLWLKALREQGIEEAQAQRVCDRIAEQYVPWQEDSFPGLLSNVVAGRIANRLDLHGTNCTVDAACASSLAAVSAAANELALGKADLVLTGGVDATNNPLMYVCFSKTPALSPTGDARPFSEDADGTLLGEGLAMLALRRLDAAERDGDRIYAVIRGLGTSSDGKGGAIYAPVATGQARALRRAYASAGYGPDTVELVEAHGTATRAGDAAEFRSLREVFGETGRPDTGWCALGSVKSQIGHTKAAAGAAGLIKVVLALHQRVLPPTIKVRKPNPGLGVEDSPFYLNTAVRPWTRRADHPRRASVSSFGFGGANYHVALEEYGGADASGDRRATRVRASASEVVLLSGDSPGDLRARLLDGGRERLAPTLAELAAESRRDFDRGQPFRLAVVATDAGDLREKLDRATEMAGRQPDSPFALPGGVCYDRGPAVPGRIAFVFPGQGSQYTGMGGDIAMAFPAAQNVWDLAGGLDLGEQALADIVFPVPAFTDEHRAAQESRLTDTRWAQPALAAHSLSMLALLASIGVQPDCAAGHSLGELVALHAAGAMDAESLLRLARHRGELLARMDGEPGTMLAVGADADAVAAAIRELALADLWLANVNAPRQTVVSGSVRAIEELHGRLSAAGVTARRLAVSAAFHSPLARSAVEPLREFLGELELTAPRIDVYGNADAAIYRGEPDVIRGRLAEHPAAPVRFGDQIEAMYADGVRTFIEVGAGSALTGLIGQILGDREHAAVSLDKRGRDGVTAWQEAAGRLAVRGVPMDLQKLSPGGNLGSAGPAPRAARPRMSVRVNGTGYAPPPAPKPARPAPTPPAHARPARSLPAPTLPAPTLPEPAAAMTQPDPAAQWLAAAQELQRQTAEAHMHFQRVLADSHQAFLQMAENTFAAFAGQPPPLPQPGPAAASMPPAPASMPPAPGPQAAPPPVSEPPIPQPYFPGSPPPGAAATTEPVSLALLLSVVADKTGYPVDMLNGGMDLETDLGIDSIKKVEIFAAVRERAEGLPSTDSPEMELLFQARSLDEVMRRAAGTSAIVPSAVPSVAGTDAAEHGPAVAVHRIPVRAVAAPACGLALAGLGGGPITVVDGGSGLAAAVVAQLDAHGIAAMAADLPERDAWGAILLSGLAPVSAPEQAGSASRAAFQAARAVAASMEERGGVFVTVQDTGGCFGLKDPDPQRAWLGGLAALARTAAREWPRAAVKAIDCQRGGRGSTAVATAIVGELVTGGCTLDVGLRADGTRWTLADGEPMAAPAPELPISPDAVLVVSGGARGVTAAALVSLASVSLASGGQPRMLLIGRTALADEPEFLASARDQPALTRLLAERGHSDDTPAQLAIQARAILARREVRATLAAVEQAGAIARYAALDITDSEALRRELARVRQEWGPVTGLVHGAGVLADKRIADKTDDQFDHVYATKVAGLRALLAATASDPLELLCAFSSVAARYGNPGQCDYAMANEVLNQVARAERQRRPSCRVRALGWGPWDAGMVTASRAAHFTRLGVPLISLAAGARAFVAELGAAGDTAPVLVTAAPERDRGRLATGPPRVAVEVTVNARTHGFLSDHAPAGVPVLPLAMAMEWFAAAGHSRHPGRITFLSDIRVLSGIELPDLAARGHRFTIEGTGAEHDLGALDLRLVSSAGPAAAALTSPAGAAHYRARLIAPFASPRAWSTPDAMGEPFTGPVYEAAELFHGPLFRVLQRVRGLSRRGAEARVAGVRAIGWAGGPWWTDPAAIDGALQAAVLWARHATGDATLPMSVDALRVHHAGPAPGTLRCLVHATSIAADQSRCDIALLDEDGEVRTELLGVSLIRRPDTAPAYGAGALGTDAVAVTAASARPA
jgi:acyl transferase domain-containing protein/NADP-dependent 3-hydroxy acid dehydrogenase YdfG